MIHINQFKSSRKHESKRKCPTDDMSQIFYAFSYFSLKHLKYQWKKVTRVFHIYFSRTQFLEHNSMPVEC